MSDEAEHWTIIRYCSKCSFILINSHQPWCLLSWLLNAVTSSPNSLPSPLGATQPLPVWPRTRLLSPSHAGLISVLLVSWDLDCNLSVWTLPFAGPQCDWHIGQVPDKASSSSEVPPRALLSHLWASPFPRCTDSWHHSACPITKFVLLICFPRASLHPARVSSPLAYSRHSGNIFEHTYKSSPNRCTNKNPRS